MSKLIVLDRDGVINEDSDEYIKSPAEWIPIPGSLEAIARLHGAGYSVVVATNQSGVARGYFTVDTLAQIHQKMLSEVALHGGAIDAIFFCPHGPGDNCRCRKPEPGMFQEIQDRYRVDLRGVYAVGDSYRDIAAARAAGAKPILVKTGKGKSTLAKHSTELPDVPVYANLAACVEALLQAERST